MKPFTVFVVVLFTIAALISVFVVAEEALEVKVNVPGANNKGFLGTYITSSKGRRVAAFYGISYAKPPIGHRRFSAPQRIDSWTGYLNALVEREGCPRPEAPGRPMITNEDCLYLNVFQPLSPKTEGPLPVMVYFDGGAFLDDRTPVQPDYLLDHDVVLVTGKYRTGVLGFLNLETNACPGNQGLKDQGEILWWVQRHISAFNGASDRVTIIGGASVNFHQIARPSTGLYKKVILHGGSMFAPWAFDHQNQHIALAKQFMFLMECEWHTHDNFGDRMVNCLNERKVEDILAASSLISQIHDKSYDLFLPSIEYKSEEAMVSTHPANATSSHWLSVPMIIGVTAQQGNEALMKLYGNANQMSEYSRKLDSFIANVANLSPNKNKKEIGKLRSYYFSKARVSLQDTFRNITAFINDAWIFAPMDQFITHRVFRYTGRYPITYLYVYDHRGALTMADCPAEQYEPCQNTDWGVFYGDDIIAVTPLKTKDVTKRVPTKDDRFVQETMTEMWINFAASEKDHDPSIMSRRMNFKWNAASAHKDPIAYLRVGSEPRKNLFSMETGFLGQRMDIWRDIRKYKAAAVPAT